MNVLSRRIERLETTEARQIPGGELSRRIDEGKRRVLGLGPDEALPTEEQLLRRDLGYGPAEALPEAALSFLQEAGCPAGERHVSGGDGWLVDALAAGWVRAERRNTIVTHFRRA
jgi:hypothetical protein